MHFKLKAKFNAISAFKRTPTPEFVDDDDDHHHHQQCVLLMMMMIRDIPKIAHFSARPPILCANELFSTFRGPVFSVF